MAAATVEIIVEAITAQAMAEAVIAAAVITPEQAMAWDRVLTT